MELLNDEVISSQTNIIVLNSHNWQIARKIFSEFAVLTKIEASGTAH